MNAMRVAMDVLQGKRASQASDPIKAVKHAINDSGISTRKTSKDGYRLVGFQFRASNKCWVVERVDDNKRFFATTKFVKERFLTESKLATQ